MDDKKNKSVSSESDRQDTPEFVTEDTYSDEELLKRAFSKDAVSSPSPESSDDDWVEHLQLDFSQEDGQTFSSTDDERPDKGSPSVRDQISAKNSTPVKDDVPTHNPVSAASPHPSPRHERLDEEEDSTSGKSYKIPIICLCIGIAAVAILLVVVLFYNGTNSNSGLYVPAQTQSSPPESPAQESQVSETSLAETQPLTQPPITTAAETAASQPSSSPVSSSSSDTSLDHGIHFDPVNVQVTAKIETNLRSEPSTRRDDTVVTTIYNGDWVTQIGVSSNGWSKVEYNGQVLYAVTSLLTTDPDGNYSGTY